MRYNLQDVMIQNLKSIRFYHFQFSRYKLLNLSNQKWPIACLDRDNYGVNNNVIVTTLAIMVFQRLGCVYQL